ncbi:similar to Saccharomyces cerevisiae YDR184C ATC1 Nuclear protein, possibly involved in regulation of cation stress responses and/or in the establishment of bipolar budding pattern [Maudiozyma barnettii]|uniref:Similar to Saccharomyces cerevisiae YDR184C ATC1 Nuclear protein, possibly involved in regulation of cation stress responses and/or in the establishment of bipolar budding pattern n=1 Tax=Maudiozyma barnettii TaxID=61262 RepID=A0A8H2VF08_9SACH|nr:Atc1p [Kazachstania barnettii]CAB4253933.1 similar to Saccharomyces cerevisiae YDR184C ATC1 Nuclear protein, possibly involved in regulation of cation stress responses and/or in the establishment of bipolar budding pattern [Kazachstania barnettii]CAD1781683.1 similar to Saccharomyces cerevisiae YDR184C ATC1 Nuclear protein, possibly involved in regulation of cation stress responses and/or in the establishment of bipolar budding pattern [Kazachstania barnettii]
MTEVQSRTTDLEEGQDHMLESALHQLLTDSDDPFQEDPSNPFTNDPTMVFNQNDTEHEHSNDETDIERAIESAITNMNNTDIIDASLLNDKQLSLDTILGENTHAADMDMHLTDLLGTNNNMKKRSIDNLDDEITTLEIEKKKKVKTQKNIKDIRIYKTTDEPFLSPASLSPSSTLSPENSETQIKLESLPITSYNKKKQKKIASKGKTLTSETLKADIPIPDKYTNEFTMTQVTDIKKRIVSTHKLILNFNFLKDGYARTCVELKKAMMCLKDSEIHRAHLLTENEQLKKEIAALQTTVKEEDIS